MRNGSVMMSRANPMIMRTAPKIAEIMLLEDTRRSAR